MGNQTLVTRESPLVDLLIRHEGMRLYPYRDTAGKLTIGVGRNLDDRGISSEEACCLLLNDISIAADDLHTIFSEEVLSGLNEARFAVLVSMAFNLGRSGFAKFKKTIAAVNAGDWEQAAFQMQQSKWARQVGKRAIDLCWMMRNGQFQRV